MGFFGRFRKKKEPEMPYASREVGEEIRSVQPPMSEGEDPFSERVITELEAQGFTINWRYGYRLGNRYEVKRVCAGGMGVVFIVEDLVEKGKRYAAKTLKAYFRKPEAEYEWDRWRKSADDYLRECNIWVDLGEHPHIVHAEYLEKIEGIPLVMSEFIDGGGLDDWLEKGPLDVATALDFAIQSCIGMEYANRRGVIIHRDIKPGNILVTRDGVAKINDFGIAKAIESAEAIRPEAGVEATFDSASPFVTRGKGTPGYMAPEQFGGSLLDYVGYPEVPLGREADIYAFGLVLYEMIAGVPAVEVKSDREMEILREASHIVSYFDLAPRLKNGEYAMRYALYFLKTLKVKPPRPSRNERLNAIIFKCLEKYPSERYHNFAELRIDLMRIYPEEAEMEFQIVEEPAYELNWRNKGKTCWILGREKEALECYEKALEQNPADTLAWLEKGLASAEAGDLAEFGVCMEIISYLEPSRRDLAESYKRFVLNQLSVHTRDIRLIDRLVSENAVSNTIRQWICNEARQFTDPFREPNPVLQKLLEDLNDENQTTRRLAAGALGELGDRSAVPALIRAIRDGDFMVRQNAAMALGKLGDKSAVPALLEALNDEKSLVREKVAEALGKLGDKSVVPVLIKSIRGEEEDVRVKLAEALCKLGDRSAESVLIQALKNDDSDKGYVRLEAIEALGEVGDRSVVPALLEALKDEDGGVRAKAARALCKLGDRSAVQALIEALDDVNGRIFAAEALADLGEASAVPALLEALKNERGTVGPFLIEALGKSGDKSAVPTLIKTLNDVDSSWRRSAAEALGELGDKSAIPALFEALERPFWKGKADSLDDYISKQPESNRDYIRRQHEGLCVNVAKALGKLANKQATNELLEALASSPEPIYLLVALRWACSQPDKAKLSQMKEKLKEYSAFEWNKRGSELLAIEDYEGALKCFDKAIEIDPDWEVPEKARDEAPTLDCRDELRVDT